MLRLAFKSQLRISHTRDIASNSVLSDDPPGPTGLALHSLGNLSCIEQQLAGFDTETGNLAYAWMYAMRCARYYRSPD